MEGCLTDKYTGRNIDVPGHDQMAFQYSGPVRQVLLYISFLFFSYMYVDICERK